MSRTVVFSAAAEADALEARAWYESRRSGLGVEFGHAIDSVIERIRANPFLFPRVHSETRRAVLHRFPAVIYFRSVDDVIVVLAVHGRQDPKRWQARL